MFEPTGPKVSEVPHLYPVDVMKSILMFLAEILQSGSTTKNCETNHM